MNLVKLIELQYFDDDSGGIVVMESQSNNIPFEIKRVFNVSSPKNSIRGKHAHRECTQLLVCNNGSVEVVCDNGIEVCQYTLDKPSLGLLISPGIWAQQKYIEENTILTVLCNQTYSESDYIREYKEFLEFVSNKEK
jgi:UDP-2-acetamido-3-amino-2,3-dideoxy-glucuronate N-acetyltransferase|tara:strand:- start:59 stop:469 length:411 start_codon:yes stop_codon:yes gene_type:complete